MRYYGNPSSPKVRDLMVARDDFGMITTPRQGNVLMDGVSVIADNGCYGDGFPGYGKWISWLESMTPRVAQFEFATAPDVFDAESGIGDAPATLDRSMPWLPAIRSLGYPVAFVAQDGSEAPGMIPWDLLDVLFIGGGDEWKRGRRSQFVIEEALRRGKKVHMGRCVNGLSSMWSAHERGCHTSDSTYLRFGPDRNVDNVIRWLDIINQQTGLFPQPGGVV